MRSASKPLRFLRGTHGDGTRTGSIASELTPFAPDLAKIRDDPEFLPNPVAEIDNPPPHDPVKRPEAPLDHARLAPERSN
jgi:hypothetical protein